jgi:hypothetical protein
LFLESLQKFPKNIFFTQKEQLLVTGLLLLCKILPKGREKKLRLLLLQGVLFEYFGKKFNKKSMDFGLGSPDLERLIWRPPNISSIRKQFDYPAVAKSG